MLMDMYPLAVQSGIDAERYWNMNLREIIVQSEANRKRHIEALKERAVMDHKLSELMAFAVNDPNKMPDVDKMYGFDELDDKQEPQEPIPDWKRDQMEFMKQAEAIRNARKSKQAGGE